MMSVSTGALVDGSIDCRTCSCSDRKTYLLFEVGLFFCLYPFAGK